MMRKDNSRRDRNSSFGGKKRGDSEKGTFRKRDDDKGAGKSFSDRPKRTFRDDKPRGDSPTGQKRSSLGKSNESAFGDRRKSFRDDKPRNDAAPDERSGYAGRSKENSFDDRKKYFRDVKPKDDSSSRQKRSYSGSRNESSFGDRRKNFRDDRKQNEPPSFMHKKKYADRATKVEKNKRKFDFGQEFTNKETPVKREGFEKRERSEGKSSFGDKRKTFARKENFSGDRREERNSFDDKRKPFPRKENFSRDRKDERPFERKDRKPFDADRKNNFKSERKSSRTSQPKSSGNNQQEDGLIRLNKYIANSGVCSRREADDMITAGIISVNGVIVTQLGTKISPTDEVKYNNETLRRESNVYVLLNKPKDYITTSDDPEKRNTVMELIADACKERIYPVGRLDRNTTGVLLLTNDGELTKKLTHPSSNIKKIYHVELDKNVKATDLDKIAAGVELEDGIAHVDAVSYDDPIDKSHVGIEIHSGKNRVVRRIFEALEYEVQKLDRVVFAGLTKKDLPRGRWRFLTELEVSSLKMKSGKKPRVRQE